MNELLFKIYEKYMSFQMHGNKSYINNNQYPVSGILKLKIWSLYTMHLHYNNPSNNIQIYIVALHFQITFGSNMRLIGGPL